MYRIPKWPDTTDPLLRLRAQDDVPGAIEADTEHLLRTPAAFAPASAAVGLRYYYRPAGRGIELGERLQMFLLGQSHTDSEAMRLLLQGGLFKRFYELEPVDECLVDWTAFKATCDVVRRQELIPATITGEFNARALPAYYRLRPFEPRRDYDHLRLDAVLDAMECPVLIEVCVEPIGRDGVLQQKLTYLGTLQSINRVWDGDGETVVKSWFSPGASVGNPAPLRQREPLVDSIIRTEQRNYETLLQSHLAFHIRVFAPQAETATLVASVVADSAFAEGSYQLFTSVHGDPWFERLQIGGDRLRVVALPVSECLLANWQDPRFRDLPRLGTMAPPEELLSVFKPPHAAFGTTKCIATSTDPPGADERNSIIFGHDVSFEHGKKLRRSLGVARGPVLTNLAKGVFISGMPGNGKTIAIFHLLMQLFARGIPFIVLESGNKRDYRALKCLKQCKDKTLRSLAEALRIYTPGYRAVAGMRLNPLPQLGGVSTNEWIENLVGCFQGAMPMFEPLPEFLAQSLERVYDNSRACTSPPTMLDLYQAARLTLRGTDYAGDVKSNLQSAIETRLGGLTRRSAGQIFQCRHSVPAIDELLSSYSVIEMASLTPERMALLTLFLLTCINARIKATSDPGKLIRLVIILEEAHNLVGPKHDTSGSTEDHVDPKAYAADLICRMLAEYRSLRVSLVIVDQLASAVAPEVVKQTATKLSFRQADAPERETITAAMLCGLFDAELIGELVPGLCLMHTEGYHRAKLIQTRHLQQEFNIPAPPVGRAILPYLQDEEWFRSASDAWQRDDLDRLEGALETLDDHRTDVFAETRELLAKSRRLVQSRKNPQSGDFTAVRNQARRLWARLDRALASFRSQCRPWLLDDAASTVVNEAHEIRRDRMLDRFRSAVEPGSLACLRILEDLADGTHPMYSILKGGAK